MKNHMLLLMRHAKTEPAGGAQRDFDRMLTDRGREDAGKMGVWLRKKKIIPAVMVSSTAARAERTALIVCRETGFDPAAIVWEPRIYDAARDDLLEVIEAHGHGARSLLLIGHNPGLEEALEFLAGDQAESNSAGKVLTTAAIAILDYGEHPVGSGPGTARLLCLARPHD